MHSPEHADEAAAARRTGGLRRRREKAIAVAYDIEGVETVAQLRRVLEIVLTDALGLENSVARARVLLSAVMVGAKLLEVGEHEERLRAIEDVLGPKLAKERGRR